jgi:hypothetical protein
MPPSRFPPSPTFSDSSRGWLRQYVFYDRRIAKAVYADFTGIGACDISSLGRWASRRLTESEALAEFPDEVAKIKKQLEEKPTPPIHHISRRSWRPIPALRRKKPLR